MIEKRKRIRSGEPYDFRKAPPLWKNRDYLLLWFGQSVSSLGTGISQLAFPLLILALTGSPADAGFAIALGQLPLALFSLPAGALVDRWNRKRVMIFCTTGLLACLGSIPLALVSGYLTIYALYFISFLVGTFSIFYQLAELGSLIQVVPKAQIATAVAQNEAAYSAVMLLAPSSSGWLFGVRKSLPFVADAISYLVLLGALFGIRASLQPASGDAPRNLFEEVRAGIYWLWSHPIIRTLAFLVSYVFMVIEGSVLIVLVIARQQALPSGSIGLIFATGGFGSLLGTILCTPLQRRVRLGRALGILIALFGLLWPFYSLVRSPFLLGALVAGLALIDSIVAILVSSYRLAVVPDHLQGRIGSLYRLIVFGLSALGQVLVEILLQQFGILITVFALWSGLIIFAGILFINPRMCQASFPSSERVEQRDSV